MPPTAPPALAAGTLAEGERWWPLCTASERARETARDAGAQRSSSSAPPRAPRAASGAQRGGVARAGGAEPSRRRSSTLIARRHPVRALPPPRAAARQAREQPRSCGGEGAGLTQSARARDPAQRRACPKPARAPRRGRSAGVRPTPRSAVYGMSSTDLSAINVWRQRAGPAVTENHRGPASAQRSGREPRRRRTDALCPSHPFKRSTWEGWRQSCACGRGVARLFTHAFAMDRNRCTLGIRIEGDAH